MAHTKVEARTIDGRQTGPLPTHMEEHHLPLPDDQLGNKDQKLFSLASLC